ncbi:type II toxin-antitoxin system RelE/ParE family toxin [Rhizobium sp. GN54]|uniref:type II toxin-antitoxin system RelE/ParE family toxin n=1 Tax=Rhizobium sp. GN54 TaxID=2898150 RepID=UPI001E2BE8BB|nr:type II toxin-antitoxin system RelE/ParE family toxin [Rhizobium sp. GN54]MCD2181339.1 type II toxin-antitoxin system RelE/ParE family toxin [Rhizobium sp. GN54]
MNLSFSSRALADLTAIRKFIAKDDAIAADRVVVRILQSIAMLRHFPTLGRDGRVPETRELPIVRLPYFAVYHFPVEREIEVIAIVHERRRFP